MGISGGKSRSLQEMLEVDEVNIQDFEGDYAPRIEASRVTQVGDEHILNASTWLKKRKSIFIFSNLTT